MASRDPECIWFVNCPVNPHVGMWQQWFRRQCVAVGWPPGAGYQLGVPDPYDRSWNVARNCLNNMNIGDYVVVALGNRRVGRIGRITRPAVGDEWDPFVLPGEEHKHGELGRRILVRWELDMGPSDFDLVVQRPPKLGSLGQGTVFRSHKLLERWEEFIEEMGDPSNWVSLHGTFKREEAISDYIAEHPHRLEDGLIPHPTKKRREMKFKNGERADVMLMDKKQKTVIVECKQHSPSVGNIEQLQGYMQQYKKQYSEIPRGILVHAGAPKLSSDTENAANREPRVEVVNYVLDVKFGAGWRG